MAPASSQCSDRRTCTKNGPISHLPFTGTDLHITMSLLTQLLYYYISAANIITRKLFELLKSSYISESSNISLKYFFACHSQPALGHFNDDGILDLFFQHSANGIMKVKQIVHLGVFFKAQTNARAHTLHQSAALF